MPRAVIYHLRVNLLVGTKHRKTRTPPPPIQTRLTAQGTAKPFVSVVCAGYKKISSCSFSFAFFAPYIFAALAHALALIGFGRTISANNRSNLPDLLPINPVIRSSVGLAALISIPSGMANTTSWLKQGSKPAHARAPAPDSRPPQFLACAQRGYALPR